MDVTVECCFSAIIRRDVPMPGVSSQVHVNTNIIY